MKKILKPSLIEAPGEKVKIIEEYFGMVNSGDKRVSIAVMKSPKGWSEPGQTPEFDEYTVVINGSLKIETERGFEKIRSGEGVLISSGEWVRYSSPEKDTEYISVCLPAFSPETVHRDE
jgi:mannose-6-phosphate isomerase-like protein (cupin superfamily)